VNLSLSAGNEWRRVQVALPAMTKRDSPGLHLTPPALGPILDQFSIGTVWPKDSQIALDDVAVHY
jgi:hypothetical protein